jgi:hypothetical protein
MATHWTPEQVTALAPDAASLKAAEGLASPRKWVSMGRDDASAWGECQGSGAKPYQVIIDLAEPAFHCSCPSHKFPCKHSLALFLQLTRKPDSVTAGTPPGWVEEWAAKRAARAEKASAKAAGAAEKAADPAAQARRADQRQKKILNGLAELDLWLSDLVRRGLVSTQGQGYGYWDGIAARMVDAQAPGAARYLREMAGIPTSGEGWQERLLARIGLLYLLSQGYQRLDDLPEATRADLRAGIGWPVKAEEILALPGIRDHWQVFGRRVETDDNLKTQRSWLYGRSSGGIALVLDFAYGNQPLDTSLIPGTQFEAELVYYPGSTPMRAAVKTRLSETVAGGEPPGFANIASAVASYAAAISANPWIETVLLPLANVIPAGSVSRLQLVDADGCGLPVASIFGSGWELIALCGGKPVTLVGEWDGAALLPLSVWVEGRLVAMV